jgi:hypothetical protein
MVEILYWLFIGACVGGFGAFAGRCLRPMICAQFKIDLRSAEVAEDYFTLLFMLRNGIGPGPHSTLIRLILCTSGWTLVCALISVAAFYLGSPSTVNVAMLLAGIGLSAFAQNAFIGLIWQVQV